MSLDLDPNHIFRDFVIDGMPASGKHDPKKVEIRRHLSDIWQAVIALLADANPGLTLPNLLIRYTVTGGTANAIEATPNQAPPSGPGLALFSIQITRDNTGQVTINGKPLLTNGGQPLAAGDLKVADLLLFLDAGNAFRLVNDPASWRNKIAAELAQFHAEDAAARALAIAGNYEDLQEAVNSASAKASEASTSASEALGFRDDTYASEGRAQNLVDAAQAAYVGFEPGTFYDLGHVTDQIQLFPSDLGRVTAA